MTRRLLMTLGAAVTLGCGQDPARSMKIPRAAASAAAAPVTPAAAAVAATRPALHWSAAMCEPAAAEPPGPSSVVGNGACAFEQHRGATCVLTDDDLLMKVTGPMANDGLFMMFVTVENFGSRTRQQVEVVVGVENSQGLFRWTTHSAHATVGPDETFVTFAASRLTPVPPLKEQDVVVSGTLTCASTVVAPDAK
jgi:hypothetical protein